MKKPKLTEEKSAILPLEVNNDILIDAKKWLKDFSSTKACKEQPYDDSVYALVVCDDDLNYNYGQKVKKRRKHAPLRLHAMYVNWELIYLRSNRTHTRKNLTRRKK